MSVSPQKPSVKTKFIIFDKDGYLTEEAIQICKDIGINEQDLYERDVQEFIEEGQNADTITKIQQMRYQHYEQRRQVKINAVKETMKLIRGMEEERQRAVEQTFKQVNQMSVLDIKQNKNKELKLQQIISQMEKEQLFSSQQDSVEQKKQTIQNDYINENGYDPKDISKARKNQQSNQSFHLKNSYGIQPQQNEYKPNKHRSYSNVKTNGNDEQYIKKGLTNLNTSNNYNNNQSLLSDAQNMSLASKSVVLQGGGSRKYHFTQGDIEEEFRSKYTTLEKSNSRNQKKFLNNTTSLSPYSRHQAGLNNQSMSSQNMSNVADNLNYDVKLKLVRKLMRMERNDEIKKEIAKQQEDKDKEIKEDLEQKEQIFAKNHAQIIKQKEQALRKRMKDQKEHQEIIRQQVKSKQREQEKERMKIKKQQIQEIQLRMQLEQQKLEEEEKQSFLRYLERNEEKRAIEQFKKAKYEDQIQKARSFMEEIEKEQQAKQQKHEQILAEKQKELSKKIEQRQNRARSNMIMREQEKEASKSHTIQKIIQSTQPKTSPLNERRRNVSVYNSTKINDIKHKKEVMEREQSKKLMDKVKQYEIKSKQAEQFKNQIHNDNAAQKKEQFLLKREGILENIAIQDYQWELQRQKEMDKYKQKLEIAKINKNIKEEINFLTQQGVKEMYNIIKKQKEV